MHGVNNVLSSFLYIETFGILVIAFCSWKRKRVSGAFPLFFLCLCSAVYSFGYGMEITSVSLLNVDFWSKFEYLGLSFIPALWIIQAYSLVYKDKKIGKMWTTVLFIISLLTCVFRFTNKYFHFMYSNEKLINNGYFYIISYEKCFWYYLYYIFFFACIIISITMYCRAFLKSEGLARHQLKMMIYISTGALLLEVFDQFQIVPLKMDYGAFIMFFVYALFAYVVYPFDIMDIVPVSREIIFDWVYDGVIVVDTDFNLKDFNCAAKEVFNSLDRNLIGTKIELCTREAPEFEKLLKMWYKGCGECLEEVFKENFSENVFEFSITKNENTSYFKARLKALCYKEYRIGSTILISDITREKGMIFELEKMARFDQLTEIFNRRQFIELINAEFNKLAEQDDKGVLFMFDIDHFKKINDTYGHQAGDYILREISFIAKNIIKNKNFMGRYGGEEFIAFLPKLSLKEAVPVIERIRNSFENHNFVYDNVHIKVTASFGVTEYYKQNSGKYFSYKEMVKKADTALYRAKENGRNQIAVS